MSPKRDVRPHDHSATGFPAASSGTREGSSTPGVVTLTGRQAEPQRGDDLLARARRRDEPNAIDAGAAGDPRGRDRSPTPASPSAPSSAGQSAPQAAAADPQAPRGGVVPPGRWRRSALAGTAGVGRSRVSRAARRSVSRRSTAGELRGGRDQLELAFDGLAPTVALPEKDLETSPLPYSVISPFPATPPSPAKPRRLVSSRAVPASYVVPAPAREPRTARWLRALRSAADEMRVFFAPPAPRARLQPVSTSPAGAGRIAPHFDSFGDPSGAARAASGWGEQIALLAALLGAIALAWFIG